MSKFVFSSGAYIQDRRETVSKPNFGETNCTQKACVLCNSATERICGCNCHNLSSKKFEVIYVRDWYDPQFQNMTVGALSSLGAGFYFQVKNQILIVVLSELRANGISVKHLPFD